MRLVSSKRGASAVATAVFVACAAALLQPSMLLAQSAGESASQEVLERVGVAEHLRETAEAEQLVEDEMDLRHRRALQAERAALDDPDVQQALSAVPDSRENDTAMFADAPSTWPAWALLLPRISVRGAVDVRSGASRQDRDALATLNAEFPMGPPPRLPLALRLAAVAAGPSPPPGPAAQNTPSATLPMTAPSCLADLRAAAVRAALLDPTRARSMLRRARTAAWLPEIRLRVERRLGRNEALDLDNSVHLAPLQLDTINDIRYEVRATWDLASVVFNSQEIQAHRQALRAMELHREIGSTVNHLFFRRRLLLADRAPDEADVPDGFDGGAAREAKRQNQVAELDAELDALTAGALPGCR